MLCRHKLLVHKTTFQESEVGRLRHCRTLGKPSLINVRQSAVFMTSRLVELKRIDTPLPLHGLHPHLSNFEMQ
jgi:hypothetical protein